MSSIQNASGKTPHHTLGEPLTLPLWPAAAAPPAAPENLKALSGEPATAANRKIALIVTHGMGQQIPFKTLDQVEQGLRRVALELTPQSIARTVKLGEERLQRLEMTVATKEGEGPATEIHLYEAYWAPLTEGKVSLRDVMSFLWRGGVSGLCNSGANFWRWMFGGKVDFGARPGTYLTLLGAFAVLFTLVLINTIIGTVGAFLIVGGHGALPAPSGELVTGLTWTLFIWLALLGVLAALAYLTKRMAFFYAILVATLLAGVVIVKLLFNELCEPGAVAASDNGFFFIFWGMLLLGSKKIRTLLIQYMGDVAAYLSPQYLDRFAGIRAAIKERVGKTFGAVYKCLDANGSGFEYQAVAVIGHSLGSVISYDALNAMINEDLLADGNLNVVGRTRLLLTFGSPLDKTAFVFANQRDCTTESREALAAAVQPLIQDYRHRQFPWINVYSPADIISGKLDFYDDPQKEDSKQWWIDNCVDDQATLPVIAHVQYWNTDEVWKKLFETLIPNARSSTHHGAPPSGRKPPL